MLFLRSFEFKCLKLLGNLIFLGYCLIEIEGDLVVVRGLGSVERMNFLAENERVGLARVQELFERSGGSHGRVQGIFGSVHLPLHQVQPFDRRLRLCFHYLFNSPFDVPAVRSVRRRIILVASPLSKWRSV